jgi:hypothetical protein
MPVPNEMVGAWRRSGLILNGARQVDYCDVIWLQTPEWYADIRLLIDSKVTVPTAGVPSFFYQQLAFAGPASWAAPVMTWDHQLDFNLGSSLDSNPLTWQDGVTLECGTATVDSRPAPFIEEWLRMTDDHVTWSAEHVDSWARIEVGRWAVEIHDDRPNGQFVATRYERGSGGWAPFGSVQT